MPRDRLFLRVTPEQLERRSETLVPIIATRYADGAVSVLAEHQEPEVGQTHETRDDARGGTRDE